MIESPSGNVLTAQSTAFSIVPGADVIRRQTVAGGMITRVHALSTDSTKCQTLQQSRTFARGSLSVVARTRATVLLQLHLVVLELLPADVTRMRPVKHNLPLFNRQARY